MPGYFLAARGLRVLAAVFERAGFAAGFFAFGVLAAMMATPL